jgi:hypothetical protein
MWAARRTIIDCSSKQFSTAAHCAVAVDAAEDRAHLNASGGNPLFEGDDRAGDLADRDSDGLADLKTSPIKIQPLALGERNPGTNRSVER